MRRTLPLLRRVHPAAHRQGLQGGHLRADRGPQSGKGAGQPGYHPRGHSGYRGCVHAGGQPVQLYLRYLYGRGDRRALLLRHHHRQNPRHRLLRSGTAEPCDKRAGPVLAGGGSAQSPRLRGGGAAEAAAGEVQLSGGELRRGPVCSGRRPVPGKKAVRPRRCPGRPRSRRGHGPGGAAVLPL